MNRGLSGAHLPHGNEEIFLFRGGVRSISDLTLGEKNIKNQGSFCNFFPVFPSPKQRTDVQKLFIDSLLLTFHKLFPSFILWSFSIA